jgi:uncharacterized membrane protein
MDKASSDDADSADGDGREILHVILRPHRSLSPTGFWIVMGLLAGVSFSAGTVFWWLGAWPVIGFMGLDVALVYIAFKASYARAHEYERLHLTRQKLTIERVDHWGKVERLALQPYWLRVELDQPRGRQNRLLLTSHGRAVAVGGFLAPAEKAKLAGILRDALATARE